MIGKACGLTSTCCFAIAHWTSCCLAVLLVLVVWCLLHFPSTCVAFAAAKISVQPIFSMPHMLQFRHGSLLVSSNKFFDLSFIDWCFSQFAALYSKVPLFIHPSPVNGNACGMGTYPTAQAASRSDWCMLI